MLTVFLRYYNVKHESLTDCYLYYMNIYQMCYVLFISEVIHIIIKTGCSYNVF